MLLLAILAFAVAGIASGQSALDPAPPPLIDEKRMNKLDGNASDAGKDDHSEQKPIREHQPQIKPTANHDPDQRQTADKSWEKWVAIGSLVTNILLAVFGALGWWVIRGQLGEMQKTNEQAERASSEDARTIQRTLAALERSNELTGLGIEASKRQAQESNQLARDTAERTLTLMAESNRVTRESAAESNRLTQESNRLSSGNRLIAKLEFLEQYRGKIRVWDVVDGSTSDPANLSVTVTFENVGRAKSEPVQAIGRIAVVDEPFDSSTWDQGHQLFMERSLEPGATAQLTLLPIPPIEAAEWERVVRGERSLYAFGYAHLGADDFKERQQHLYFCYKLAKRSTGPSTYEHDWIPCHNNNTLEYDKTWLEMHENRGDKRPTLPGHILPDRW